MRNQLLLSLCILFSMQITTTSAPSDSQAKSCAEQSKAGLKRRIVSKAHSAELQQTMLAQINETTAAAAATVSQMHHQMN